MSLLLEVKFKGGLGNQLFQYSTARCLSIQQGISWLLLNTESYKNDVAGREFGLLNFPIRGYVEKSGLTGKFFRKGTRLNRLLDKLPFYQRIEEKGLTLQHFPVKFKMATSLSGYWQSEAYFKSIRPVLLKELVPVERPDFPGWQNKEDTVAVHIRRGDYLVENGFGSLKESYYHEAISAIRSRINNPVFVFFSDDIPWCKEKFSDAGFIFCEEKGWEKDYLQLFLMSTCKNQIIANSSFSWWGAWLNANPDKLVIRPEKPFANDALMYESYYPPEWIAVDNRK